jgi:hypothetical protein
MYNHFEAHFKAGDMVRPGVNDLNIKTLNVLERRDLITLFSEEEVNLVVWDCDNFKIPRLDDINFRFIKDFWVELKCDVMRFLSEFHRNGKLCVKFELHLYSFNPKGGESVEVE